MPKCKYPECNNEIEPPTATNGYCCGACKSREEIERIGLKAMCKKYGEPYRDPKSFSFTS